MHSDFNFEWVIDEIKETLQDELDFLKEGANSEKCAKDLCKFQYIYVPKIHWDLCTNVNVLLPHILQIFNTLFIESSSHGVYRWY